MDEKDRIYRKGKSVIGQDGRKSSYIGEDDFVSLVKGGITINFHIKHPTLDIENTFRTVKRAQRIVKDKFDLTLEKIDIDIYNSMEEMRQDGRSRSRYASWIAGIFDGKIRVISEKTDEDPEALYIILTHEIIHLAVFEMSKGNCPYWLDEGLAVCLSQELPRQYLDALHKAVKADRILPLEALENPLPPDSPEDVRQLAYAQVTGISEYLIETYGWDKVKSIVFQCVRRPAKAVLSDLSLNYYLVEQGWKRWLRGKIA
jgi:hypothetical protein